jgi:hypothetical protein
LLVQMSKNTVHTPLPSFNQNFRQNNRHIVTIFVKFNYLEVYDALLN